MLHSASISVPYCCLLSLYTKRLYFKVVVTFVQMLQLLCRLTFLVKVCQLFRVIQIKCSSFFTKGKGFSNQLCKATSMVHLTGEVVTFWSRSCNKQLICLFVFISAMHWTKWVATVSEEPELYCTKLTVHGCFLLSQSGNSIYSWNSVPFCFRYIPVSAKIHFKSSYTQSLSLSANFVFEKCLDFIFITTCANRPLATPNCVCQGLSNCELQPLGGS